MNLTICTWPGGGRAPHAPQQPGLQAKRSVNTPPFQRPLGYCADPPRGGLGGGGAMVRHQGPGRERVTGIVCHATQGTPPPPAPRALWARIVPLGRDLCARHRPTCATRDCATPHACITPQHMARPVVVHSSSCHAPPPPGCGMQMCNADPYHEGTKAAEQQTRNKRLFSDIAVGDLRCDRRGTLKLSMVRAHTPPPPRPRAAASRPPLSPSSGDMVLQEQDDRVLQA